MTREEVVAEARSWVGTPYRRRGRTPSGIDCLGLLIVVARAFSVPHIDHTDYGDWPDPQRRILREFDQRLKIMPANGRLAGGIGVFNQRAIRLPAHVGIFGEKDSVPAIIHARIDVSEVVEEIYRPRDPLTDLRLIRLYAFPDLEL
jgi:hypothetical protein